MIRPYTLICQLAMGCNLSQDICMKFDAKEITEAFPSATVVLVRDGDAGLEVLMVCRSEQVKHMGGMWVFPGGRVDPEDHTENGDIYDAALNAAIRETQEEAGLDIAADHLFYVSHWTTPEGAKKRFATWFFVGVLEEHQDVVVDGGEISHHRWVLPAQALEEQKRGELRLMPPTFISLLELAAFSDCASLRADMSARDPIIYAPRVTDLDGELHFLYEGDAGFEDGDPARQGLRHRCIMAKESLVYIREPQ
jgi:8-oxo-dGTP pyrophosphatase MutT (NUDIX family)